MRSIPAPLLIIAMAGLAFFATFVVGSVKMAAAIIVLAFLIGLTLPKGRRPKQ